MTKKEPFFTSVSFFMRADSLTLERSRFPECFFPQHLVEGILNFCRRECVVSLGGIGLRRTPRGNGTGIIVVVVIPLRFLFSLCILVLPFFPPRRLRGCSLFARAQISNFTPQITAMQSFCYPPSSAWRKLRRGCSLSVIPRRLPGANYGDAVFLGGRGADADI